MHRASRWIRLMGWFCLTTLVACASGPKPTLVKASIEAAANTNPDARGRPSPVVLRFYELKTLAAFSQADFFSLYEKDKETLGAEMVGREEFQLLPGERKTLTRAIQTEGRHIGVIAAFRDLEHAQWRANFAVPAGKISNILIKLEGKKVSISGS